MTTTEGLGNVLVVGGRGFVGGHCIRHLLATGGPDLKVFTMNSKLPNEEDKMASVVYIRADLGDAHAVQEAVQQAQPKVIIHVASPRPFVEPDHVYDRVNIQGIRHLLNACDTLGTTKAFVYCSSVSVIDDGYSDIRHGDESWPVLYAPHQKERYWHSKAMGETYVLAHNRKNQQKMLTIALRVTSIFGEGDKQIIGEILDNAKTGNIKTQIGDGKNLNCWTYVGTVAAAHAHAAKRLLQAWDSSPLPEDQRVEGEAFFITNDDPRPFFAFSRQVAAAAGYPVNPAEITVLPAFMAWVIGYVSEWYTFVASLGQRKAFLCRKSMGMCVREQVYSMEKAKKRLGFVPEVGIDEAIERSVKGLKKES